MKIDRRCFLTLGAGLAVGTTLTPVPWKLMDDVSIWTQNWSWTPVPEKGAESFKNSVCALCPGGCGITAKLVKDRVIKIEGREDYPVNKGSICPLGLSGAQYLYGPSRIKSPMKRVGERGSGRFEPIGWDEALGAVSTKLAELRTKGKPHSVACISDSDRGTVPYLVDRFLLAYGSANFIRTPSFLDTHELALYLTQGRQGAIGFDLENANFILSFGCGLLDGPGASGRNFQLVSHLDRHHQLVQVEPRLSDTAAKATKWLAARPGTEGALALGIAHVIVRNRMYNIDFMENFSFGFEDWTDEAGTPHMGFKTLVQDYTPSKVAGITGLPPEEIERLARAFARAKRPVAISGLGRGPVAGNIDETLAVHALNALVGNINQPGGMMVIPEPDFMNWSEMQIDQTASMGRQQSRIDEAGTEKFPNTRYLIHRIPEIINNTKGESPIQALLITDANPLYTVENTAATLKAFQKIPFIVSFSTFMDESARYADIILPNHHFLERYQDVPMPEGSAQRIIGLCQPVIEPLYDTRHIGDSILAIAQSFDGSISTAFPWKDYETFLKETFSENWETLSENGYWADPRTPAPWQEAFQSPSGKYEFYPTARNNRSGADTDALPGYRQVPISGDEKTFPLVMLPYNSIRLVSGAIANSPFMMKTVDADVLRDGISFVQINPATAKTFNLKEGDFAVLQTPRGEANVRINLYDGIMPGLVAMPRGLGHTAYNEFIADKGANVNALLDTVLDPSSGLNTGWGIRASLRKV